MKSIKNLISLGYLLMALLVIGIMYIWYKEWCDLEKLEVQNRHIDTFRQESHEIFVLLIELSLSGETVLEWEYADLEHYHYQRMAMDSMLCRFKTIYPTERIDSVRYLLEDKERQMHQIVQVLEQQQAINDKITRQVPVIVQKSVQEQPQKPKRKRFLGIFGKKEKPKPTVTTTMLRSLDRDMIAKQRAQSRRLSEHTDNLVARNAKLNRQLHGFIRQMDKKVQADLQKREAEITAMREQSFMQIGSLTGFVFLLLVISYIIIHRNANRIKRYKQKTTDLIGQLQQSVEQNEALIASRKKAVHTITHELRTPLTAITGYAGLVEKENDIERIGRYICNIRQSSDRMREMLNTLLSFFRLDNGKEQPNISPCRISAITHILETEFTPIAMNKGLALTITNQTDTVVLTDKERILQIGNNLLSNAIKFTENGGVSLTMDYNNGALKLIVEDTGTGMTDEEQQRVFGAFERLSNATAKDGFGLGLSIVQRIVTMLGGTIRLKSEKGKGSHIKVEIPMQTIPQIGKEFDLLRFGDNYIINIEIKTESSIDKIFKQQQKNKYYLEFLNKEIYIYTYILNENKLYKLIRKDSNNEIKEATFNELCNKLLLQEVVTFNNIDDLFNPSDYLVSPFNSPEKFMAEGYFLTVQQEQIYNEIRTKLSDATTKFIALTGSAGTGKTLLTYHIAKESIRKGEKVLILHCAPLNSGHKILMEEYGWSIHMPKYAPNTTDFDLIIIDEAQRMYPYQFDKYIEEVRTFNKKCIFSYDENQYLRDNEKNYHTKERIEKELSCTPYKLTDKIRTNKEIAYFIRQLFNLKKNISNIDYPNIELTYCKNYFSAKSLLQELSKKNWKVPNYTPGTRSTFHYEAYLSGDTECAHSVVGQEFDNVVIVIDDSFKYNSQGDLIADNTYYSQRQMLYQIITRTRKKLHIVIIDNEVMLDRCIDILNK